MTKPQRYMMATTAHHKLGDISRDQPDLAYIDREDGDDFIGQWVTGAGYIEVRFPKTTTRELTAEERERFDGCELEMSGRIVGRIELPEPAADHPARLAAGTEQQ